MDFLEPTFHHFHHQHHQQHHDQLSQAAPYSEHNTHIYLNTMAQHSSGIMGIPVAKTNETKPRLGKEEVEILEREFKKNPKPTTQTKKQYADDMDVELARINNWFQNRRAKRKQEKKQEAYELQQGQEAAGYSEPSSPDFYSGSFGDSQFLPLQHANTFPMMSGPPQPAAPYNPQYPDPTTASMESLQRTMAAAQASYGPHHQEFQRSYQDPNEAFEHFGGPALSNSDQAQFPPVDVAVTQFNEPRSFSFPSSVHTSLYTHSNPSITDLHASPVASASTHFNTYCNPPAHGTDVSRQQPISAFPSQLLAEQAHEGLPMSVHGSYDSQSPQDSNSSAQAIGFKFDTIDSSDASPPAPTIPFKSPPPMDIASRRKKVAVKPAALTADSMKGRPQMGPRTVSHADNRRRSSDSPLGSPMRRVMSAGGMRSIVSGRINKNGVESAQRSPINLGGFSDAGSFMEHNYHTIRQPPSLTAGSSLNSSLAPPTPMSPRGGEMTLVKREGNRLTESPSHGGLSFMYSESIPAFYASSEGDQNLASPPETPQAQLALQPSVVNGWSTGNDLQDKQWAFEVPDEPLYTPAQDGFQLEMQMPQPSYLNTMSQPVTPAFGQHFNPNFMFGVPEEPEYRHESPRYMLPSNHEYTFPDNTQHGSRMSTSPMSKHKTFQFSNQTPADFSEKK